MRGVRAAALVLVSLAGAFGVARPDTHAVTVRNGGPETIRAIQVGPPGRLGENRMRSQLPQGAQARITYSTGCAADVRLTYASGQTEDHTGVDVCTEPVVVAGQAGVAGPVVAAIPAPAASGGSGAVPAAGAAGKPVPAAAQVAKIPVPPWTGRSITRRFGGMD